MPTQGELESAVESKQALVDDRMSVPEQTLALLATVSDSDLKKVPVVLWHLAVPADLQQETESPALS